MAYKKLNPFSLFKRFKPKQPARSRAELRLRLIKQALATSIAAVVIIVAVYLLATSVSHQSSQPAVAESGGNGPKYQTVLPDGKTLAKLGGWRRVSPPDDSPVYAFEDKIGDVGISVSQQPLPKSFQANPHDHVAKLAKRFNAADKLTAGDTTLYVGTSVKGPQSVILTKAGLLILIKSKQKVSDAKWIDYVSSLNNIYTRNVPKY